MGRRVVVTVADDVVVDKNDDSVGMIMMMMNIGNG